MHRARNVLSVGTGGGKQCRNSRGKASSTLSFPDFGYRMHHIAVPDVNTSPRLRGEVGALSRAG
jgi:hypothetical protein